MMISPLKLSIHPSRLHEAGGHEDNLEGLRRIESKCLKAKSKMNPPRKRLAVGERSPWRSLPQERVVVPGKALCRSRRSGTFSSEILQILSGEGSRRVPLSVHPAILHYDWTTHTAQGCGVVTAQV